MVNVLSVSFFHDHTDLLCSTATLAPDSLAESKNRLPALIHEAENDEPIFIHRRGKTDRGAAVLGDLYAADAKTSSFIYAGV